MDILTHTITGTVAGTLVAAYSRRPLKYRLKIVLAGTIAGAFPDLDALSLWSGFDNTIGSWLGLPKGRSIYFGKYWYSHHAAFHSLFMAFLVPLLWWFIGGLVNRSSNKLSYRLRNRWTVNKLGMFAFTLGYALHLIQDMITPSGSWGGVRLFFPMQEYYGGWGKIWWWNNYDLFLIVALVATINLIVVLINRKKREICSVVFGVGVLTFAVQLWLRPTNFNGSNLGVFSSKESKSKSIQKEILPKAVYKKMEDFDNSMNLNF